MKTSKYNDLEDIALLDLLHLEDDESKEAALETLLNKYSYVVNDYMKLNGIKDSSFKFKGLLELAHVISQQEILPNESLIYNIEKKLPAKLAELFDVNHVTKVTTFRQEFKLESQVIKWAYPAINDQEISDLLQVPYDPSLNIVYQAKKYGYTPLRSQIRLLDWLVLFKLHQDPPDISYSSLNRYLGFDIGHIKKIEWWTKYEIFEILKIGDLDDK